MNIRKLILCNISYYRKTHLGVFAGVVLASAIITGALIVGDSVKYSLKQMSLSRLGSVNYALTTGGRFFTDELSVRLSESSKYRVASLLMMRGSAVARGGASRANHVSIIGIDSGFSLLWPKRKKLVVEKNEIVINRVLARKLGVKTGDYILLKMRKTSHVTGDSPLGRDEHIALILMINRIIDNKGYGRFSLQTSQLVPNIAFIDREFLSGMCGIAGKSNTMLVAGEPDTQLMNKLQSLTRAALSIEDLGLSIKQDMITKYNEVKSDQVFIPYSIAETVMKSGKNGYGIFSYFVNSIEFNGKSTPYSFAAASGNIDIKDGEIIVSDWVADDIGVKVGDELNIKYYVIDKMRKLDTRTTSFKVAKVVSLKDRIWDSSFMPDFPGLTDSESCSDWDPSLPIDTRKIRDKDEKYWDNYKGTPKVLVSIAKAKEMWGNRFGQLTAVRFPVKGNTVEAISSEILKTIPADRIGFVFKDVKSDAIRASSEGVDFGQLFIGLSFFIIVAAIMLTSLLFVFGIEMRSGEIGTLQALGFSVDQVKKIFMIEGMLIAFAGTVVGTFAGVFYNSIVLFSLGSIWREVVGSSDLQTLINPFTVVTGFLISLIIAALSIYFTIRKFSLKSVHELQSGRVVSSPWVSGKNMKLKVITIFCFVCVVCMIALLGPGKGKDAAGGFFGAGFLMLIGCITFVYLIILKVTNLKEEKFSKFIFIFKNLCRTPKRCLTVIGLLASGVFLVVAVASNRHDPAIGVEKVSSGTGGYSYYCESAIPVFEDMNDPDVLEKNGLGKLKSDLSFVQIKVKSGNDASCLNLNRVAEPRLLGINPELFAKRNAFSFASLAEGVDPNSTWMELEKNLPPGTIPGIADQAVIQWGLGKSVGDTIDYTDEFGQKIKVKLVAGLKNSIFQGSILISGKNMTKFYPSINGYSVLLIDSKNKSKELKDKLSEAFEDFGMDIESCKERIAHFGSVENTYLTIFMSLGGLGILIGTVGLGIVVIRNILERRRQIALLRAVGYSYSSVKNILLLEHVTLLIIGIVVGTVSAIVAVLPAILTSIEDIPCYAVSVVVLLIFANGIFWIYVAIANATKGTLIEALRDE